MANGITGIDHLLIGARDLEAARDTYVRLGFTITPRGRHIGWSTGNYCIMFPTDYLELIGVVDSGQPASSIKRRIAERGDGLIGVALATADAEAAFRELGAAGVAPEPVRSLGRALDLPEGTVTPRFSLVQLPPAATPQVPMFLCQHLSPELVRRPAWLVHPNTAVGVRSVIAAVAEPNAVVETCTRLFGVAAVGRTDDMVSVRLGSATILLATPRDIAELHPDLDTTTVQAPALVACAIAVGDLATTMRHLSDHSVAYERDGRAGLVVAPEDAGGVLIEFVAAR